MVAEPVERYRAARDPAPRASLLPELLLVAALTVNVAVALAARHFPYQDMPNHLARYVLMDRFWFGEAPPAIDVRFLPGPYLGLDLLGVALVHALGARGASDVITVLALVLPPAGMYALLRATAPARRGWALVGVLLGFSWFLLGGMTNFVIGLGLGFFWLAAWWPRRETSSWRSRAMLALGGAALFFTHLAAPLTILVVIWIDYALATLWAWSRSAGAFAVRVRDALLRPQLATVLAVTASIAVLWIGTDLAAGDPAGDESWFRFRGPPEKLLAFGAPFYSFSLPQAAVMALGYATSALAFAFLNREDLRVEPLLTSAAVFVLLFLAFPEEIGSAGGTDVRWLMPAYLLPFCVPATRAPARPQHWALGLAFAACLAHAATVHAHARALDRKLDDFDAVLREVPKGSRLLPIISDQRSYPRVGPYQQYAHWHIIDNHGQVPGLFSITGTREGDLPFAHFRHFVKHRLPYYPSHTWGTKETHPLDWDRIAAEHDFIVHTSDDEGVRNYIAANARERLRVGAIGLYEVVRRSAP